MQRPTWIWIRMLTGKARPRSPDAVPETRREIRSNRVLHPTPVLDYNERQQNQGQECMKHVFLLRGLASWPKS